jgi:hypothetical protein
MAESSKNGRRFMLFQRTLDDLQRQTTELHRLAVAADRRTRKPMAAVKRTVSKKR